MHRPVGIMRLDNVVQAALTVVLCLFATASAVNDDYSAWTYSRNVSLNTTATGAALSGNLTNFPVLVRLSNANFMFSQAQGRGRDVRFAKPNGVHLPYQIERWDSAGAVAEIWVKVDTIFTGNSSQYFKMFYGNPAASDSSRGSVVFDTTKTTANQGGYAGVWHFSPIDTFKDATADTFNLINTRTTPVASSNIAAGRAMTGGTRAAPTYLSKPAMPRMDVTDSLTVMAWIKLDNSLLDQKIVGKVNTTINRGFVIGVDTITASGGTGFLKPEFWDSMGTRTSFKAGAIPSNLWTHVAVTWAKGGHMFGYVNGVQVKDTLASTYGLGTDTNDLTIGTNPWWRDTFFVFGEIDEVRLSKIARSADWIKLCYESQKTGATWLGIPAAGAAPLVTVPPSSKTTSIDSSVSFTVSVAGAAPFRYQWYKSGVVRTADTLATLTIAKVAIGDTGAYSVVVTNASASAASSRAVLSIIPRIVTQPQSVSVGAGSTLTLVSSAVGSIPLSYQWSRNGTQISGATSATYIKTTVTPADSGTYTVYVSNGVGNVTSNPAIVTINSAPSNLTYKRASVICTTGTAITPDTATVTGTVDSFTVSPPLPAGLSIARPTGIVSGTPTTATATAAYTVTARNAAGSTTVSLSITVNAALVAPTNLTYKHNPVVYATNAPIVPDTATVTGTVDSFTVSPPLPAGLSIARPTGIVSGTPTTATAAAAYIVTARNAAGSTTVSLSITVNTALVAPTNLSYKHNPVVYVTNAPIVPDTATVTGTVDSFTVSPPLPAGLSIAKPAGIISGTPTTATVAATYTVTATNAAGSTTASLSITVYAAVKAAIWSHDSSGPAPLTTQFNDTSGGSYSNRRWDFGDGTIDTVSKSLSHTFTTAGTFIVKLAVWGNGGSDTAKKTILTWSPLTNPLQMDGKYLMTSPSGDSQKVALLIRNVNAINPPVLVTVDSVGLWFAAGKIPTSPDSSTFRKKYLLSTLQSQVGGQYADTVMVQAVPAIPGYGGFMTVLYWSDGNKTAFSSGNGVLIPMKDTVAPVNDLTLSGVFVPSDTARLYVGNPSGIDQSKVDSMFIWYSLTSDSANFEDKTFTKGLSIAEVTNALVNNQYPFSIVDKSFSSAKKTIYCAVMLLGKNKVPSPAKKYQFQVGFDRPANPITLHAKALSATRIQVSWNNISAAGVSRVVIWYQKGKAVDTVYDVSGQNLDSLTPSVTDTVIIGSNFNEMTHYYFGAQVLKGGLWSQITTNASANDSTPAALGPLDSNALALLKLTTACPVFDTSTNSIRIGWAMNRNAVDSLDIGISYSTISAAADTVVGQTIVQPAGGKDTVAVKLHEDLAFNTLYYVKLWLRRPAGKWTDPGAGSACAVLVPSFTWQSIVYFRRDPDSVYAFNREIRLMNQPLDVSTNPNIVRYVAPPAAATGNFTQVSVGFELSVKDRGTPIYVGLKVDSVPAGHALTDVRIYRDSAGRMLLSREQTVYDPVNRYVSVLTNNYDYPFVAMVDRQAPTCRTLSDPSAYVAASKPVFDTVIVRDNIANCSWRYLTARGGDPYDTSKGKVGGFLKDTIETLAVMIDSLFVTQDNGVRALLIVDDGVHYDTVNLSRSVLRDGSDIALTEPQNWVPLSVTADLDSPDVRKVLRELPGTGGSWKYDDTKFRIFRCFSEPDTARPWKWVEYADTLSDEFEFVRGNIIWIKTLKQNTVRFGPSHTASLTSACSLRIAPMGWTDMSLPYKFDINAGDILGATVGGDSLEFCEWKRSVTSHKYSAELMFNKATNDVHYNNPATPLSSNAAGYAVYNPTHDTVVLEVPPLPVALSHQGLQKKKSGSSPSAGWTIRVASSEEDGSPLSSVYCGYSPSASTSATSAEHSAPTYYPLPPSFGNAHVGVSDQYGKNVYGLAIAHAMAGGGCAYVLTFINDGASKTRISYHCSSVSTVPQGMTVAVWDAARGRFEDFATNGDAAVTVEAGTKEYRTLLVGNAGYLAKAKLLGRPSLLALVGTYPNPFRAAVRIRYSIPYEGVKIVTFALYNLSGRVMWRREVKDVTRPGERDLVWNGDGANGKPVAAGIYVLRMTALNSSLKQAGVFERKMTLLP